MGIISLNNNKKANYPRSTIWNKRVSTTMFSNQLSMNKVNRENGDKA